MSVASFIDMAQIRRRILQFLLSMLYLVGMLLVNALIDNREAQNLVASISAVFRNDQTIGNTALLSRRMADLETLGLIKCLRIESETIGEIYSSQFKDDCRPQVNPFSRFRWKSGVLRSVSGEMFSFQFKLVSKSEYTTLFNLLLVVGILAINGILVWYWSMMDTKARELALNQTLANLAEQVSHDIRSPLSALKIAMTNLGGAPDESREMIVQVCNRISDIANDLLERHRRDRRDPLAAESADLRKVLGQIFEEKMLTLGSQKRISVKLDLPGEQFAKTNIGESDLTRIVSNIVNNALEAIHQQGEITIAMRVCSKNVAAIIVSDTGFGIPEEILARLGEERFSMGKHGTGSGLGLWNAKKVVEAVGGNLTVQSKVGVGTMVTLTLPIV